MTKLLTKEQRAEMRREVQEIIDYYMAGDHFNPDLRKSKDILKRYIAEIEQERDLATAKLATARVCETCGGSQEILKTFADASGMPHDEPVDCPHCTNGVQFSDERARELLERLKRAEEALDTMPVQAMAIVGPPYTVTFSPSAFELIRAARAK